jgi:predicted polyphosphate/ATP-dependent NAD kinase
VFRIGLVINPLAGIGGAVALKGSDGAAVVQAALAGGAVPRAGRRAKLALEQLQGYRDRVSFVTWGSDMGATVLRDLGFNYTLAGECAGASSGVDTRAAVEVFQQMAVDVIVFVGGDGTARDVFDAIGADTPVLGIPAGVKMHSGVYAVSPSAAGELLVLLLTGKLVNLRRCEVRDIDEQALRSGQLVAGFYGEMLVPEEGRFLQHVKQSGREVEELVLQDIAAEVVETMEPGVLYIIGPGTTPRAVMEELGLASTLLGVDVVCDSHLLLQDATESELLDVIRQHPGAASIVVTVTGGQGSLFGRGNQQISARVLAAVGLEQLQIVATKTKISALQGRPLLVDTGDVAMDKALSGYRRVITGYHDHILYPVNTVLEQPVEAQCS